MNVAETHPPIAFSISLRQTRLGLCPPSQPKTRFLLRASSLFCKIHEPTPIPRRELGLSIPVLRARLDKVLESDGLKVSLHSVRMRLDRVFNPNLRLPTSEQTLIALAKALDWTFDELQAAFEQVALAAR